MGCRNPMTLLHPPTLGPGIPMSGLGAHGRAGVLLTMALFTEQAPGSGGSLTPVQTGAAGRLTGWAAPPAGEPWRRAQLDAELGELDSSGRCPPLTQLGALGRAQPGQPHKWPAGPLSG